jgi:hypothetical protein
MDTEQRPAADTFEDEVEQAIDDTRDGVVAADATGMIGNEELIRVVELREGELTPPA